MATMNKDAFNIAKEWYNDDTTTKKERALLKRMFPELKESEDERVIKRIKTAVESYWSDEPLYEILAWLEKKGEQKPADLPKGEDYGIDGLYHAIEILEKTLGKVDGYQTDGGILEHKCAITAVKELYEQAALREEEEQTFYKSVEALEDFGKFELADWLKDHKDRLV